MERSWTVKGIMKVQYGFRATPCNGKQSNEKMLLVRSKSELKPLEKHGEVIKLA